MAHNLDYATIVMDEARYGNVEGVEYFEVVTGMGTFKFAQNVPAVLPSLLKELAEFRKAAKREMEEARRRGDEWTASVCNAKQLAYKITMNSVYGFTGAAKGGKLPCVPIAASVTSVGRQMIEKTKHLAETLVPGSRVIYGDTDSVMVILNLGEDRKHDMHAHFKAAADLAERISATFKRPIELEFEKIYFPYLLFSKKRYTGVGRQQGWAGVGKKNPVKTTHTTRMRTLTLILAAWLTMIFTDAVFGWPVFREVVEKFVRLWCTVVAPSWDQEQCTARTFHNRMLWAVISAASAAAAWVVVSDVMRR